MRLRDLEGLDIRPSGYIRLVIVLITESKISVKDVMFFTVV